MRRSLIALTTAALFLPAAPAVAAGADASWSLQNDTGTELTALVAYPYPQCAGGSTTGVFRQVTGGLFPGSYTGQGFDGSVTASGCTAPFYLAAELGVLDGTLSPLDVTGGAGFFSFAGLLLPDIQLRPGGPAGISLMTCFSGNPSNAEALGLTPINQLMSVAAEGSTCAVEPLQSATTAAAAASPAAQIRSVSSFANVTNGRARVRIEAFASTRTSARVTVALRSGLEVVGRTTNRITTGAPVTVAVRVKDGAAASGRFSRVALAIRSRGTIAHKVPRYLLNRGRAITLEARTPGR